MIVWKHMFLKIYKKVEVSKISSTSALMALSMAEAINFFKVFIFQSEKLDCEILSTILSLLNDESVFLK